MQNVLSSVECSLSQLLVNGYVITMCVQALRKIGQDFLILMLCVTVFLSYLPEAGEYSSFFVYLRLVSGTCRAPHSWHFCHSVIHYLSQSVSAVLTVVIYNIFCVIIIRVQGVLENNLGHG